MIFFSKKERAQGLVEYAISLALIFIAVMGATRALGTAVNHTFSQINDSLQDRGIELHYEGEDESDDLSTPTPTDEPTATPTPTPTPSPTPTPTDDGCVVLRGAYTSAVDAYQACGGGWGCWSEYNAVIRAYIALRNAGCE